MRPIPVVLIALVIVGCGGGGPPSASSDLPVAVPLSEPDKPVATVPGAYPGTSLGLISVRRAGSVVTAKVRLFADRSTGDPGDLVGVNPYSPLAEVDEMRLVDEVNGRTHHPLEEKDGECLCSDFHHVTPGGSVDLYAKFPAPPADVDTVSLQVPSFPSFDGLRIEPA